MKPRKSGPPFGSGGPQSRLESLPSSLIEALARRVGEALQGLGSLQDGDDQTLETSSPNGIPVSNRVSPGSRRSTRNRKGVSPTVARGGLGSTSRLTTDRTPPEQRPSCGVEPEGLPRQRVRPSLFSTGGSPAMSFILSELLAAPLCMRDLSPAPVPARLPVERPHTPGESEPDSSAAPGSQFEPSALDSPGESEPDSLSAALLVRLVLREFMRDGEISPHEKEVFAVLRDLSSLSPVELDRIVDEERALYRLQQSSRSDSLSAKGLLLRTLWLAYRDRKVSDRERAMLDELVQRLEVAPEEFARLEKEVARRAGVSEPDES